MRIASLLLLMLVWPRALAAGELHKCVDDAGAVSFQSAPCAAGARTLWTRTVASEPTPVRPAAQVAAEKRAPRSRPATPVVRAAPRRDPRASRCESARRAAETIRDKHWNRLGFRERSELDAKVARACAE